MRQLLDDLRDYNRTSLGVGIRIAAQPVDLATVCREEIELLQAALPASTIELATTGTAPSIPKELMNSLSRCAAAR